MSIFNISYRELLATSTSIPKDEPLRDFPPIGTPLPSHRPSSVDIEWEYICTQLNIQKAAFQQNLYSAPRSRSPSESTSSKSKPSTVEGASGSPPLVAYSTEHTSPAKVVGGCFEELPDSQHQGSSSPHVMAYSNEHTRPPRPIVRSSEDMPNIQYQDNSSPHPAASSTDHTSPPESLLGQSEELPDSQHQSSSSEVVVGQDEGNDTTNAAQQHTGPNAVASAMNRWLQQGSNEFQPQGQGNSSSSFAAAAIPGAQVGVSGGGFGASNNVTSDRHWYIDRINEQISADRQIEAAVLQNELEERLMWERKARRQQQRQRRQQGNRRSYP
ncbi:MAG: hypothetical protein LQ342_002500 [Letrouitia transgressa]|nr:MAG: hypothetical protein LQ342_002500 [Letrouitia transgressa]